MVGGVMSWGVLGSSAPTMKESDQPGEGAIRQASVQIRPKNPASTPELLAFDLSSLSQEESPPLLVRGPRQLNRTGNSGGRVKKDSQGHRAWLMVLAVHLPINAGGDGDWRLPGH